MFVLLFQMKRGRRENVTKRTQNKLKEVETNTGAAGRRALLQHNQRLKAPVRPAG